MINTRIARSFIRPKPTEKSLRKTRFEQDVRLIKIYMRSQELNGKIMAASVILSPRTWDIIARFNNIPPAILALMYLKTAEKILYLVVCETTQLQLSIDEWKAGDADLKNLLEQREKQTLNIDNCVGISDRDKKMGLKIPPIFLGLFAILGYYKYHQFYSQSNISDKNNPIT